MSTLEEVRKHFNEHGIGLVRVTLHDLITDEPIGETLTDDPVILRLLSALYGCDCRGWGKRPDGFRYAELLIDADPPFGSNVRVEWGHDDVRAGERLIGPKMEREMAEAVCRYWMSLRGTRPMRHEASRADQSLIADHAALLAEVMALRAEVKP